MLDATSLHHVNDIVYKQKISLKMEILLTLLLSLTSPTTGYGDLFIKDGAPTTGYGDLFVKESTDTSSETK